MPTKVPPVVSLNRSRNPGLGLTVTRLCWFGSLPENLGWTQNRSEAPTITTVYYPGERQMTLTLRGTLNEFPGCILPSPNVS